MLPMERGWKIGFKARFCPQMIKYTTNSMKCD